ncbi:MAG: periplasmic heavy metal sensor [Bacteroidetes bacterium]|nr:periplasmic heavy metal sensor [Fibrella sp.]
MDTNKKFYWLWGAIGLLLLLNLATVGWVVRKVDTVRTNRQNPGGFMAKRLAFTPDQAAQYQQSRSQLQRQLKPHEDSLRRLRGELVGQVNQSTVADAELDRLLDRMAEQEVQITRFRFQHWRQVRAFCTPKQQAQFDKLLARLEQGISNAGPAGGLRERLRNRL